MNSKIKKIILISISVLFVLLGVLMALPFVFKDKISAIAKEQINAKLNARVDFENANLSFIRSFPNLSVKLENFKIIGNDAFSKDTLLQSGDVDLVLNLSSLFSDRGYEVRRLQFNDSRVFAHVLPNGNANWSIMKKDSSQAPDTSKMSFNLKLKDFVIDNADVIYFDEAGGKKAVIRKLNHHTSGDLTADSSLLVTKTSIDTLDFWKSGVKYISKADVVLDADINANLNDMIFSFSKNASRINAIPFSFAGWVKMLDDGYDMDLTLNAEKVDFKAILSMIPAIYANKFDGMQAGGKVDMSGFIKGKMVGDFYPAFNFKLNAVNGWFQYPSLPKKLEQINIAALITNPGKTLDETVIDISRFSFLLGGNPFNAQMRIATPMSDPDMMLKAVGKIDLGQIKQIYPLETSTQLNGVLDMNLDLAGKMSYYDNNQYDKFKFGGKMNISNMVVKMTSLPQDVSISTANMVFNNRYVDLSTLQMKIGRNDLAVNGKLENFVAYALHDKTLKGTLNLQSNYLNASDFMSSEKPKKSAEKTTAADTSKLKVITIPKNIDFAMQANFKQLVYEKMNFTNAKGALNVANGDMKIQNMGLQGFGGNLVMNGLYSTSTPEKPAVNFDLAINDVFFTEIFKQVELLQKLVPIFEKASGKFTTKLSFNSLLKQDMMPDLATFLGNGSFSTKSVGLSNVPALNALATSLKRPDLNPMSIKDLGVLFEVKDGKLITKPFNVTVADIKMNIGGSTGLDKTIAYVGKIQLPDKYNLGKLSNVSVKIGGTFAKPKVEIDLKNTMTDMLNQTAAKVQTEVTKQVDAAKEKSLEEARKQKENAVNAAQAEADRLRAEAQKLGDQLINEAQKQGNAVIAKATNPITKKIAELAAQKLVDEARKKAADLNAKADVEAKKAIQKAADQVKL